MARENSNKISTKDLILNTAFGFCSQPRLTSFSMSELAAKVGISKAAIYRHYKNKDALFEAMEDRFLQNFGELLLRVQTVSQKNPSELPVIPFSEIITLFARRPEYINFYIGKISSDKNFEKRFITKLEGMGVTILNNLRYDPKIQNSETEKIFFNLIQSFYCGTSIFILVKIREKLIQDKKEVPSVAEFSDKIVSFFAKGLAGQKNSDPECKPVKISEERFQELNALCKINVLDLPEEDRFFTALAQVIQKYSFEGVTVEHIAEEMHLAKSSLYSHFENKDKLVSVQIRRELCLMDTIVTENCSEAKNVSEFIYIMLRSEFEYFMMRPSLIPICGWLLLGNPGSTFLPAEAFKEDEKEYQLSESKDTSSFLFNFGLPISRDIFKFWISSLPFSLVAQGKECYSMGWKEFEKALRLIIHFINDGIESYQKYIEDNLTSVKKVN